jgi:DNA helicase-2/ATP-dependent DNA helicase PcrA
MLEAVREALQHGYLKSRAAAAVRGFLDLADWMAANEAELPVAELMDGVIHRAGFEQYMEKAHPGQGIERMENLRALVSAAAEYADEEDDPSLIGFLDRSALVSDADDVGSRPGVSMMTIHCAKGLEFDNVFLVGLEENIFPHARSVGMDEDVEEERRLCYVAMTRARKRLLLSRAGLRRFQGTFLPNGPSRFLEEIPEELILKVSPAMPEYRARERFERSSGSSAASPAARKFQPSGSSAVQAAALDSEDDPYRTGVAVMHPKFGRGKIMAREGAGKTLKLTIRFDGHGQKKILPSYTSLKVRA